MAKISLDSLSTKTILITGAAGRIGSATAHAALKSGATVVISDLANDRLETIGGTLKEKHGERVQMVAADVSTKHGIVNLIRQSEELAGPLNSAVHSAYPRSAGWGTSFEALEADSLSQDLAMQLGGAILFSQQILKHFQSGSGGDLVHVSSIQGIRAPKFEHYEGTSMSSPIEYSAIKAGIIAITSWLAKYHSGQGIRVNCVSPGGILDDQPDPFLKRYRQSCSNFGMLSSAQVASGILFLLSPAAEAINGHNLVIDDGWSL